MKKTFNKIIKATALVALSLTLAVPAVSFDVAAEGATLVKKYDFERGLREFFDNDPNYEIITVDGQYIKKGPENREGSDRVDANEFVIMGEGASIRYYTQGPGNQPATKLDADRGMSLFLAATNDVEQLVKEVPSNVEGDAEGSELLDAAVPVGTVVREAATYKCAMTFTNPFSAVEEADELVVGLWAKVDTTSKDEKIGLMEFSNNETALSFIYNSSVASLATRGQWHYYTYVIGKDAITTYVDGAVVEGTYVVDGTAPDDFVSFVKGAEIYFGATNVSSIRTSEETLLDNVAFYTGDMTADEVKQLSDTEYADYNEKDDITKPLAFYPMNDSSNFTDVSEDFTSSIETFNIKGHAVEGVALPEYNDVEVKAGIKLAENPFADMRLEGATIGYWVQVEPREKVIKKETKNDTKKGYTGNYPGEYVINETVLLTFADTKKHITNVKEDVKSKEGYSYIYTKNRMQAYFEEGSHFQVDIANFFEADSSDEAAAGFIDESRQWHYMTLVINNAGITQYMDGKPVEGLGENRPPRLCDGYFRRVTEREKASTFYGIFGGSGNQRATMMTSFLSYADTSMYFGWLPSSEYLNEATSPMNITRVTCYDTDLSAADVEALYNSEVEVIEALPEFSSYELGDINKDKAVNASDALEVLKIAAKLSEEKEDSKSLADMDGDDDLDANDALIILKKAARLI